MIFKNVSKLSLRRAKWEFPNNLTVLLDTNVLIYSKRPDIAEQINDLLKSLLKVGNKKTFAISEVSLFEVLSDFKMQEIETLEGIVGSYPAIPVTREVQIVSALLKKYYSEKGVNVKDISPADLYIASTSALCVCPIVTANQSDFPSCMFEEFAAKTLVWKEGGRTKNLIIYLLLPDLKKLFELEGDLNMMKSSGKTLIKTISEIGPRPKPKWKQ